MNSLYFSNSLIDWAVFDDKIIKTVDGGITWDTLITAPILDVSLGEYSTKYGFHDLCVNDNYGWISGYWGTLFMTDDRGSTWNSKSTNITSDDLFSISFVNDNVGWAAGGYRGGHFTPPDHPTILKTLDGGDSWTTQDAPGERHIISIAGNGNEVAYAIGDRDHNGSDFYRTNDGGNNWQWFDLGPDRETSSIYFRNVKEGWLGGKLNGPSEFKALLLKTTDGGLSWKTVIIDTFDSFNALHFFNLDQGLALASNVELEYNSSILSSNDGGITWKNQVSYPLGLKSLFFSDSKNGWVLGGSHLDTAYVYNTTDGGNSWNLLYSRENSSFSSIYFSDSKNG